MKQNKGITIVALIITIILMLILATVSVSMVIDGGLFSSSAKSNFYTEMTAINNQKAMGKMINFMEQRKQNGVKSNFLEKKVPAEKIKKFSNTLKAEIAFARSSFGEGYTLSTTQIWNSNLYDCQDLFSDEWIGGLTGDLSYISKKAAVYEEAYIYDAVTDMCFKIADTKIEKQIVHSLEYAEFVLDGKHSNGISLIETESGVMESTQGTKCYEPDLNNFSYKTEIVYYSPDLTNEYTISVKEFLERGKPATIAAYGRIYTFANYVPIGGEEEIVWANIKTTANGLESYWVWIPRYAYKLDASVAKAEKSEIIFVDINNKPMDGGELPEGYIVHEAFEQKQGLKGIWFSKYEPSPVETLATDYTEPETPDLTNFSPENTKLIYYTLNGANNIEVDYSQNPAQTIEQGGKIYYFYNYVNKIWANIKTTANGIDAYWVWIPRFAYKLESGESKVILINTNDEPLDKKTYGNTLPTSFKVHEAFLQEPGMKGMWFSKYEPSAVETMPIDTSEPQTPDLTNFVAENTKLIYYTIDAKSSIEVDFSAQPQQTIVQNGTTYYFYNYANKIWANIKCENDGVQSYWVWIPRFAYKAESGTANVILIDEYDVPIDTSKYGNSIPEGYKVHDAFLQQDGLKGIWFSKYEPSKHTQP